MTKTHSWYTWIEGITCSAKNERLADKSVKEVEQTRYKNEIQSYYRGKSGLRSTVHNDTNIGTTTNNNQQYKGVIIGKPKKSNRRKEKP